MLSLGRVTVDICNNGPRETMAIRDSGEKVAVVVQMLAGNGRRTFPARVVESSANTRRRRRVAACVLGRPHHSGSFDPSFLFI